jgi:small GTP-binding protein
MTEDLLNYTVICFGGPNVGISSMISRTPFDYEPEYSWGIGLEFYKERTRIGDKRVEIILFEVGKESAFDTIGRNLRRGKAGIMLVFDVTRRESLDEVVEIHEHLTKKIGSLPTLLVGNKVDLKDERVIWPVESKKVADRIGARFIETSVVDRLNVDETFRLMAEMIMRSG